MMSSYWCSIRIKPFFDLYQLVRALPGSDELKQGKNRNVHRTCTPPSGRVRTTVAIPSRFQLGWVVDRMAVTCPCPSEVRPSRPSRRLDGYLRNFSGPAFITLHRDIVQH